ncbi:MAG: sulfotransferase family 2 domain-containing protein [Chitinophagales bacterium]
MKNKKHTSPTIFFMHIPKTAGTTLSNIIKREYKESDIGMAYPRKTDMSKFDTLFAEKQFKIVLGHYKFGFHQLAKDNFVYVTFLRNPVKRTISHYKHFVKQTHRKHLLEKYTNLEAFATSPWGSNFQTKYFAGLQEEAFLEQQDKALQMAKQNLKQHIECLGITEKFDESLVLMQPILEWKNINYVRQNVGQGMVSKYFKPEKKATAAKFSEQTIAIIKENNQLDIALYNFAVALFEERTRKMPNFEERVKKFKQKNDFIQRYFPIYPYYTKAKKILTRN